MKQRLVEHGQQGGGAVLGEGVQPPPVLAREHHRLRQEAVRGTGGKVKFRCCAACEPARGVKCVRLRCSLLAARCPAASRVLNREEVQLMRGVQFSIVWRSTH